MDFRVTYSHRLFPGSIESMAIVMKLHSELFYVKTNQQKLSNYSLVLGFPNFQTVAFGAGNNQF
jgi:hypothetical protein